MGVWKWPPDPGKGTGRWGLGITKAKQGWGAGPKKRKEGTASSQAYTGPDQLAGLKKGVLCRLPDSAQQSLWYLLGDLGRQ